VLGFCSGSPYLLQNQEMRENQGVKVIFLMWSICLDFNENSEREAFLAAFLPVSV